MAEKDFPKTEDERIITPKEGEEKKEADHEPIKPPSTDLIIEDTAKEVVMKEVVDKNAEMREKAIQEANRKVKGKVRMVEEEDRAKMLDKVTQEDKRKLKGKAPMVEEEEDIIIMDVEHEANKENKNLKPKDIDEPYSGYDILDSSKPSDVAENFYNLVRKDKDLRRKGLLDDIDKHAMSSHQHPEEDPMKHAIPEVKFHERKWTDDIVPVHNVSDKLAKLQKDCFERNNVAAKAAARALGKACATECILRNTRLFSHLCSSVESLDALTVSQEFLFIFNDISDGLQVTKPERQVEAAHNEEVDSSISHSAISLIKKLLEEEEQTTAALIFLSGVKETTELADILRNEMRVWFVGYLEKALNNGFISLGDSGIAYMDRKLDADYVIVDNSIIAEVDAEMKVSSRASGRVAKAASLLRSILDWLDCAGIKENESQVETLARSVLKQAAEKLKDKIVELSVAYINSMFS